MKFACPHCQQPLEADESYAGATIDCPACGKSFVIAEIQPNPVPPMAVAAPVQESGATQKPGVSGRKRKKWVWLVGVLGVLVLAVAAFFCFGGSSENESSFALFSMSKDDADFMKNLKKGLEARWDLTNLGKNNDGNIRSYVRAELDAIGDLSEYTFKDEKLKGYAEAYCAALQSQLDALAFKGVDFMQYNELFHKKGLNERTKLLCRFVDEYGLKVGAKYEDVLADLLVVGRQMAKKEVVVKVKSQLPAEFVYMNASGYPYAACIVDDFSFEVKYWSGEKATIGIFLSGRKTADAKGQGFSRGCVIGWKLYNSDEAIVDSGSIRTSNLRVDEKFSNASDMVYGLAPGNYTLELLNVRD